MPSQPPIHLLINPAAGSGSARKRAERAYAALRTIGPVEVVESTRARDETRLATEAANANARALVVLGGDGSVSHAARGLIAARSPTPLAIFAAGTGNDFVKSLGWPAHDFLAMSRRIAEGNTRAIDAGEIDGVPFVNAAGMGFDVEVLQRMQSPSALRGTARYVSVALANLVGFRGFTARIAPSLTNDAPRWITIVLSNGQWFGGAFRIAPNASMTDGSLDLIGIRDVSAPSRAWLFARALRGTHVRSRAVLQHRVSDCTLEFSERPHFQADGELHHASSRMVVIKCLPSALRVID